MTENQKEIEIKVGTHLNPIVLLRVLLLACLCTVLLGVGEAKAAAPHGAYGTGNATGEARTDLCLACHDIHNAAGDYVLMREATVTAVCGTCHVLYGEATGSTPTWTEPPCPRTADNAGADGYSSGCATDLNTYSPEAGVSPSAAYKNLTPVSGHRLGLGSDYIPGSTRTLKVIQSADYQEGDIYNNNPASSLSATGGLYCASCHTPHGSVTGRDTNSDGYADIPTPSAIYSSDGTAITSEFFSGDQLVAGAAAAEYKFAAFPQWLASNNPNHLSARANFEECFTDSNANGKFDPGEPFDENCSYQDSNNNGHQDPEEPSLTQGLIPNGLHDRFMAPVDPVKTRDDFCLRCHDLQSGDGLDGASNNHPPLCMSCHGPALENNNAACGDYECDFPHTSMNYKLLAADSDALCLSCHAAGRLP